MSFLSDATAIKNKSTYINGFLDCSGDVLLRGGNLRLNGNLIVNSRNIALGFQAGNTNQGLNSIAIGAFSGNISQGAQSVAIGYLSAYNQTGINNTFVGQGSGGTYLAAGASNTFIGSATVNTGATVAGYNNTTLGAGATVSTSHGNSTAIGVGAITTTSNQIVLGTASERVVIKGNLYVNASTQVSQTLATFVGMGGSGASYNFDFCSYINNSGTPTNRIACIDDGAYSGHYVFYSKTPGSDSNPLVERMRIASDGTVRATKLCVNNSGGTLGSFLVSAYFSFIVGAGFPTYSQWSSGTGTSSGLAISWNHTSGGGYCSYLSNGEGGPGGHEFWRINSGQNTPVWASVYAASYPGTSDYRIKENIINIKDSSYDGQIDRIRPVYYYNTHLKSNCFGLIAHEVQEVYPDMVNGEKDAIDTKTQREIHQSLDYSQFIAILIKEIQDLRIKNKVYDNMIQKLEERITALENKN